jgi:hypothetical protein
VTGFLLWAIPFAVLLAVSIGVAIFTSNEGVGGAMIGLAIVFGVCLFAVCVSGLVRWAVLAAETRHCNAYERATGQETKLVDDGLTSWSCFVNVEGHWYPENQVYSERPAA